MLECGRPLNQSVLNILYEDNVNLSIKLFSELQISVLAFQKWKLIIKLETFFRLRNSLLQRNWVFVTNSYFLITMSLEPNVADFRYFKLWILLDQTIFVWNIKGLQHGALKILRFKYLIWFQRLNSFRKKCLLKWTDFKNVKLFILYLYKSTLYYIRREEKLKCIEFL